MRKQLAGTEGVVGFSLLARPWRKQYATLSIWTDEGALGAFADASPHRKLMSELSPEMGPTKFLRWTIRGSEVGRPGLRLSGDWPEVTRARTRNLGSWCR